ncbi:hypothetical protein BX667DRAFT_503218 [Coemansia mojavensis]|nr:hypothetical protein BX667DRAFT_503218 [Coemansia mojavensis]
MSFLANHIRLHNVWSHFFTCHLHIEISLYQNQNLRTPIMVLSSNNNGDALEQIDIDETINRLNAKKGVESVTALTIDGRVIRTTATAEQGELQGKLLSKLARTAAEMVTELEPQDELSFLRIRTKRHEIMVAPDQSYLLIVVQSPQRD